MYDANVMRKLDRLFSQNIYTQQVNAHHGMGICMNQNEKKKKRNQQET